MSTSPEPPSFEPLSGADCFLWAFDDEVRRRNGASHLAQLVLRLGPGLDPAALEKLVHEVARAQPIIRAPIGRRFGVGPPVYRLRRATSCPLPVVRVHDVAERPSDAALPPVFTDRLNERFSSRRGQLLSVDVVRYAGGSQGSDLAFTWMHMLFDGVGSVRFAQWLNELHGGVLRPDQLPDAQSAPKDAPRPTVQERREMAMTWQRHQMSFGAHPPHSLAGPLRTVRQSLRYHPETFDRDTTAHIAKRARAKAGVLTPMPFYLAAAIRAHHRVLRERGVDPGSFVVPLPVDVRPKGAEGALFRTNVSLISFQVMPEKARDLDGLIAELKSQRHDAIKRGLVQAGSVALDFARIAPKRIYAAMARRHFGGEMCSFFFAYTDAFPSALDRFLGADVWSAFHAPSVPASPGSGAIFSTHRGRLTLNHVVQDGVLPEAERALFLEQLRADLVGE